MHRLNDEERLLISFTLWGEFWEARQQWARGLTRGIAEGARIKASMLEAALCKLGIPNPYDEDHLRAMYPDALLAKKYPPKVA